MMLDLIEIAHIVFAGITLLGGLALAFTKNIIYASFLLFAVLFGIAGLYVFYGAEFLAMSQIIVYVGGILVILLFGVMLTHKLRDLKPKTEIVNLIPGLILSTGLFSIFVVFVGEIDFSQSLAKDKLDLGKAVEHVGNNAERIGVGNLTEYLLLFELASVLLLVVLIGAAYLTRKPKGEEATS